MDLLTVRNTFRPFVGHKVNYHDRPGLEMPTAIGKLLVVKTFKLSEDAVGVNLTLDTGNGEYGFGFTADQIDEVLDDKDMCHITFLGGAEVSLHQEPGE